MAEKRPICLATMVEKGTGSLTKICTIDYAINLSKMTNLFPKRKEACIKKDVQQKLRAKNFALTNYL
jgi:hypothetical protein